MVKRSFMMRYQLLLAVLVSIAVPALAVALPPPASTSPYDANGFLKVPPGVVYNSNGHPNFSKFKGMPQEKVVAAVRLWDSAYDAHGTYTDGSFVEYTIEIPPVPPPSDRPTAEAPASASTKSSFFKNIAHQFLHGKGYITIGSGASGAQRVNSLGETPTMAEGKRWSCTIYFARQSPHNVDSVGCLGGPNVL